MLAVLAWSSLTSKVANESKNALIAAVNTAAAIVFVATGEVAWALAFALAVGNLAGSWLAIRLLDNIPARAVRVLVIVAGIALSILLFWRSYGR